MDIYTSSLAFPTNDVVELARLAEDYGCALEFSSGLAPSDLSERVFLNYPLPKLAHNYFPAPHAPFVVNLASDNEVIRRRSIDHCIAGLRLSAAGGCDFFAAHAGFAVDPNPEDLGGPLPIRDAEICIASCRERFNVAVAEVLDVADEIGLPFLIENNVVIPENLLGDGSSPLLGCLSDDLLSWVQSFEGRQFGVLLDTAHLRVSAKTLGRTKETEFEHLFPNVSAFHHSDNDGHSDTNRPLTTDYWVKPYCKHLTNVPHVLEVRCGDLAEVTQQNALFETFFPTCP